MNVNKEGNSPNRFTQRQGILRATSSITCSRLTTHGYLHLIRYETILKFSPSVSLDTFQVQEVSSDLLG